MIKFVIVLSGNTEIETETELHAIISYGFNCNLPFSKEYYNGVIILTFAFQSNYNFNRANAHLE